MAAHYYAVSWDQLHRDARALAWRLMEKGPFTGIVAITRGGLIPAGVFRIGLARGLELANRLVGVARTYAHPGGLHERFRSLARGALS